ALIIVPNAEHITILFRDGSQQAVLQWLNATFNQAPTSNYVDRRMIGYGFHLLAWLGVLGSLTVAFKPSTIQTTKLGSARSWSGLFLAPLVAGASLMLMSRSMEIQNLAGLLVGGALGLWFLFTGLVWLVLLGRLPRPTRQGIGMGLVLFGLLWMAFGAMAQVSWLQWWLIPARLKVWPFLSLACLPWFLASGMVQQGVGLGRRIAWWLGQTTAIVGGLLLLLYLLPQLSFIFLLLPLFPLLIAIFSFTAAQVDEVWSYALGTSLFFGWMLAAAFPLAAKALF
ncbi:MAG TPA: hypothetical protein V6D03_15680, partial [Candidatus Caenarcaniphilales bacterium]